jgi:hypothetical protein
MIVSLNGVIQKPGSSYTVSGNTITFASNLATGDVIDFIQILGDVLDLGVPSDATVTAAKLTANSITGQTAETSIATDDTVLIHDTSAGALRKMTRANFVSGVGGANTPYFYARKTSTQTLTNGADVKVTFDTEDFDTGSEYATGTSRFVPANGNTYKIHAQINAKGSSNTVLQEARIILFKNGSEVFQMRNDTYTNNSNWMSPSISKFVTGNGSDYYEIYANVYVGSGDAQIRSGAYFSAFKLIG